MQNKIIIYFLILASIFILSAQICLADCTGASKVGTKGEVCLDDPLNLPKDQTTIPTLLGRVINAILGIVGSLALVMFIYGGIIWMTSSGNAEQVTKGKNIVIWATIGLVVIFSAYALVSFVLTKALGVT